jgi:hypothetical protein
MHELVLANRATNWQKLKSLVLDSAPSPITKRVYNLGLDEFFAWVEQEPRPGFTKATVSAWPERRDSIFPSPSGTLPIFSELLLQCAFGRRHSLVCAYARGSPTRPPPARTFGSREDGAECQPS